MNKREFVLTNGNKYVKCDINGNYKQVNNLCMADIYESQKTASNIMKNSLPKAWGHTYYVVEIVEGRQIQCNLPRPPKAERSKSTKVFQFENGCDDIKWCKSFIGLEEVFTEAEKRFKELPQKRSDIDAQIVDLEHYIEFTSLNARDGYKAYKKLKELLNERRILKYESKIVNAINVNRSASEGIKNILSAIRECQNSVYKPRVLADLFENAPSIKN